MLTVWHFVPGKQGKYLVSVLTDPQMHIHIIFELKSQVTGITCLPKLSKNVAGATAMELVRDSGLYLHVKFGLCRV